MHPDSWFPFLIILKCWNFIFNFLLLSVSGVRWYEVLILLPAEAREVYKWACQCVSMLVNVCPSGRTGGGKLPLGHEPCLILLRTSFSINELPAVLSKLFLISDFNFFFNDQSCWWILLNMEHYSAAFNLPFRTISATWRNPSLKWPVSYGQEPDIYHIFLKFSWGSYTGNLVEKRTWRRVLVF